MKKKPHEKPLPMEVRRRMSDFRVERITRYCNAWGCAKEATHRVTEGSNRLHGQYCYQHAHDKAIDMSVYKSAVSAADEEDLGTK